jgi:hypothetical protein
MQQKTQLLAKLLSRRSAQRAFSVQSAYATAAHTAQIQRADLHDFSPLDRSFMQVLESNIDLQSEDYKANYAAMLK